MTRTNHRCPLCNEPLIGLYCDVCYDHIKKQFIKYVSDATDRDIALEAWNDMTSVFLEELTGPVTMDMLYEYAMDYANEEIIPLYT